MREISEENRKFSEVFVSFFAEKESGARKKIPITIIPIVSHVLFMQFCDEIYFPSPFFQFDFNIAMSFDEFFTAQSPAKINKLKNNTE